MYANTLFESLYEVPTWVIVLRYPPSSFGRHMAVN